MLARLGCGLDQPLPFEQSRTTLRSFEEIVQGDASEMVFRAVPTGVKRAISQALDRLSCEADFLFELCQRCRNGLLPL